MTKNDVKKGNKIVKLLIGGGAETASIQKIEHVDDKTIYLSGCDGDYKRDSVYAYDLATGKACSSFIPGFTSRLVYLED
jgi:hypothetical protein